MMAYSFYVRNITRLNLQIEAWLAASDATLFRRYQLASHDFSSPFERTLRDARQFPRAVTNATLRKSCIGFLFLRQAHNPTWMR